MGQTINVTPNGDGELIIRSGEALPLQEPQKTHMIGAINAVSLWLQKRIDTINQLEAYIQVSKEGGQIFLRIDESNYYGTSIVGNLVMSEKFKELGINSDKSYEPYELAKLFRMNRTLFESTEKAIQTISDLKSFKAKVQKDMEKTKDSRGNYTGIQQQAVESNIPESVKLSLPIFNGQDHETITVEFDIDSSTLEISLVSPQAADIIDGTTSRIIDGEIDKIKEIAPNIAIVYL